MIWIGVQRYDGNTRRWLQRSDHYLGNAPPGGLFAIGVTEGASPLLGDLPMSVGPLLGLCLVGRPVARRLAQDGSVGEVTRMFLEPGLPYGTASVVLRYAARTAAQRGMHSLIAYHDRTRHTGCIYRKAGFKKDGRTDPKPGAWGSRAGRTSAAYEPAPKRRWRLLLPVVE